MLSDKSNAIKKGWNTDGEYLERADFTWSEDSIRVINTPTLTAKKLYFYVQEVGLFKTTAPYFTERANLDSYLLLYTLSGKGHLRYHGNNYTLEAGSCCYINCLDHHLYECISGQEWKFLWIHFNGSCAEGYFEEYTRNGFSLSNSVNHSLLETTMRRILALTQKKDLHSETIISSLITQILTELLITNNNEKHNNVELPDFISQTLTKIENDFSKPLTLDQLAAESNISKYYLSHEFSRYLGTPINEYIILTRINHAKELLKYTDTSVDEISYTCGFRNTSHFINLFKAHEEITPLQYRKKWK